MAKDLVVIEAPGKLRTVHACFQAIGLPVDAVATLGHLYENPSTLERPAIAFVRGELVETERKPARPEAFNFLRDRIKGCERRILIATDDDAEGHVIAQDVADLCRDMGIRVPVLRVLPETLTPESWRAALMSARSIEASSAAPGTARRMADRLIAYASSEPPRLIVGRVQAALAGIAERGDIPSHEARVTCRAADGGPDFSAVVPISAKLKARLPELDGVAPLSVAVRAVAPLAKPMNGSDAILALHQTLDMTVSDAASLLQSMYEAGEISYPRSSSRGLRAQGREIASLFARSRGVRLFRPDLTADIDGMEGLPHQAIHLTMSTLAKRLNVSRPLGLTGDPREAAAALIGRNMLESGLPVQRDLPTLAALPEWARAWDWHRDSRPPARPWSSTAPPALRPLSAEAALIVAQADAGIGRPSTYVSHAERFAEKRYLADDHTLNFAGRLHAQSVPAQLRQPETSALVEEAVERTGSSVTARVLTAIDIALGDDAAAVQALLAELQPDETYEEPSFTP